MLSAMRKIVLASATVMLLATPAWPQKSDNAPSGFCYLQSAFTPFDDATSLSLDALQARARGQTSRQYAIYMALAQNDLIQQIYISPQGVIGVRVERSCDTAIDAVRGQLSEIAAPVLSGSVAGTQLTEINQHWGIVSAADFERGAPPTPVPATH